MKIKEIKKIFSFSNEFTPLDGIAVAFKFLLIGILPLGLCVAGFVCGLIPDFPQFISIPLLLVGGLLLVLFAGLFCGFKIVRPNEARVFVLFGKYYGTISEPGFFYVNPFSMSVGPKDKTANNVSDANANTSLKDEISIIPAHRAVSLKTQTLSNEKQKVNDIFGNPIVIGAIVIWRVVDPTKAVFSVENYKEYLRVQTDSIVRNTARLYPYDIFDEDEDVSKTEKSLRGSSLEIADNMKSELQDRVKEAGLEIEEVRITHLAYSEEIAAAMLQRQQAAAIIAARQKIVDGAVGMVKMAIDKLNEDEVVVLDNEKKAAMVSNLLVVLCGNKDVQPVVNSNNLY